MARPDRDRLLRTYAPRLIHRADLFSGIHLPGGTVAEPDTVGGVLNVQIVDDGEPNEEPVETDETGVMVALFLPDDAAERLTLDPGQGELDDVDIEEPDELHLTLAYLGTAGTDITDAQLPALIEAVSTWATGTQPIQGTTSGIGVFNNEDTVVTYASFDAPELPTARQALVQQLTAAGLAPIANHGFTPHITLAYGDARGATPPSLPITFDTVTVAYAGRRLDIPLGAAGQSSTDVTSDESAVTVPLGDDVPPEDDPDNQNDDENSPAPAIKKGRPGPQFYASDRTFVYSLPGAGTGGNTNTFTMNTTYAPWKPVITTSGGRTVITGPATTERAAMWGTAPNPNRHMLWMQGRFVGAERPNRNRAFWSTSDLEIGQPTVTHGPLNWLHQERHVIGTIADARLVPSSSLAEAAAETSDPHIAALSAIWQWLYPQEASVVQMASDAGVLAYSMECIAQAIQCVGDTGCGQTYPYMEVAAGGGGCDHLRDRSSVRRLVNPTFLGGAVIVPPTRPGWADADATIMAPMAKAAEKAYDEAGRPDIAASTWEQLIARVVTSTQRDT